jgi:asparagine synthase (glutamine-hydrolysing)
VTVALSGDGCDEVFAGYERFAAGLAARRYAATPQPQRWVAGLAQRRLPTGRRGTSVRRFAGVAARGLPDAYRCWVSPVQDDERAELLDGSADDWALSDYERTWELSAGAHPLDRLLDLNLRTYLLDDLLVKVDRMSMAHGLEVRSPFLDAELIEFASRLPPALKLRRTVLKRVLKAAIEDLVPAAILRRPKKGFGVPVDRWFREDLSGYVASTLGSPDAHVKGHLAAGAVNRLIAEHQSGERNHGAALWTLLTLEVFLRRENW